MDACARPRTRRWRRSTPERMRARTNTHIQRHTYVYTGCSCCQTNDWRLTSTTLRRLNVKSRRWILYSSLRTSLKTRDSNRQRRNLRMNAIHGVTAEFEIAILRWECVPVNPQDRLRVRSRIGIWRGGNTKNSRHPTIHCNPSRWHGLLNFSLILFSIYCKILVLYIYITIKNILCRGKQITRIYI